MKDVLRGIWIPLLCAALSYGVIRFVDSIGKSKDTEINRLMAEQNRLLDENTRQYSSYIESNRKLTRIYDSLNHEGWELKWVRKKQ